MQIFNKCTPLNALTNTPSISLSNALASYVALNAGIPALGLWVLLCSQQTADQKSKAVFCDKYQITPAAFDKTMAKLSALNLAWQEADAGYENDWFVANVPKNIADLTEHFMFEMESLFKTESFKAESASTKNSDASVSFSQGTPSNASMNGDLIINPALAGHVMNVDWHDLRLEQDFFDVAALKLPPELVNQYWDTFIASNDNKGEMIPERTLLYKKWKSYVANVSVNLAVSERRSTQQYERKVEQNTAAQQRNIESWQALLETRIPQVQSFSAAMHNLSSVENDVWIGFIQQNIRFKSDPLNLTNLQYAFEEYCKTTGQKFLKQTAAPKEIDNQLNDTSWANNLDDIL